MTRDQRSSLNGDFVAVPQLPGAGTDGRARPLRPTSSREMADDLDDADDVSAVMETLWGPRSEAPPHLAPGLGSRSSADGDGGGPHHVDPATVGPVVPHADGDVRQELALIESWERESAERLAALEEAVGSELERLILRMEASHAELAATADLDVLRREVAAVEARMVTQADLSHRQETLVGKDEFTALRSELRGELSRGMAAAQTELQQRVALLDATIADASTQVRERLDQMATLVSTEAARAAGQATARAGIAAEPLHRELRALQEQVQQISAVVAALQQRLPEC